MNLTPDDRLLTPEFVFYHSQLQLHVRTRIYRHTSSGELPQGQS